jgi:pilus assembly protein CpaC
MNRRTRALPLVGLIAATVLVWGARPTAGEEPLRLFAGRSTVVQSPTPLARVSVTDPAVASATVVSPQQVLVNGHQPGTITLVLWDTQERMTTYDVRVEADLGALHEALRIALPKQTVTAVQSGSSIVLSGNVPSKEASDRAVSLAQAYSKNVVNLLSEVGDQVMLQVRFAEVNRVAIEELGVTLFSTGAANTLGITSTGQFGQPLANIGAVPSGVQRGRDPAAPNLVSGAKATPAELAPASFGLTDLLNVFFFRPDINFGAAIKALQQRNLLEILAEPNLLARNGKEASFLAGGEFPFPILQPSAAGNAVTIEFKEFGVRLKFTPTILPDETINLKVIQEVSALDFSNGLTVSGFVVPAIAARRAETEVQLRDGQTFAVAGLIDNRVTEIASRVPGLGHIPILGNLFRSRSKKRDKTELLAMVTPRLVKPIPAGEAVPSLSFPKPFLDDEKKDEKPEGR